MKYAVIHSKTQYQSYCKILEELVFLPKKNKDQRDEIELLNLLIRDYQDRIWKSETLDSIYILKELMRDHGYNATDLAKKIGVGKSFISEVLNKKKSISLNLAGKLAMVFAVKRDLFLEQYADFSNTESFYAAETKTEYLVKTQKQKTKRREKRN